MDLNSNSNSKISYNGSDSKTDDDNIPINNLCNETIYEVLGQISGQCQLDSPTSHVVSERVQNLASQIYTELQKIINRFSDDDEIVGGLMPLIVNVLESLDIAIIESQQLQVELELCKDDNEQLVSAFDKEKAIKKKIEQKLLEFEFQAEEEKQQYAQKINSLENIVKMLELKSKNSSDHASRLEEKEQELKTENTKVHTRYNELLRSHCDLMERMKILIGNDEPNSSSSNIVQPTTNWKSSIPKKSEVDPYSSQSEDTGANTLARNTTTVIPRQAWVDTDLSLEDASIIEEIDEIPRDREKEKETHSLTGRHSNPDKYASSVTDNFFGMEKEVQNLIRENDELLATKNALNIVKDDLIAKVDELQSDLTMAREEVQQLTAVKDKLKSRISQFEEEMKKLKEELNESKQKIAAQPEDDEEGTPLAQRKRFTRMEMARVLMERNQYKEKLIELQDAIRWTELIRASKAEGDKKSPLWKFLTSFFGTSGASGLSKEGNKSPVKSTAIRYGASNPDQVTPAFEAIKRRQRSQNPGDFLLLMDSDISSERARSLKAVRAHVPRINGDRIMAYGWSIASNCKDTGLGSNDDGSYLSSLKFRHTSVPVPIYCRPLNNDDLGLKIWCAAAVDLTGGEAGFTETQIVTQADEQSTTTTGEDTPQTKVSMSAIADLEKELRAVIIEQSDFPDAKKLSTFAWICSVSHSKSKVSIVNIKNNPSEFLDSFTVKTHLLCIASVPGAKNNHIYGFDGIDMTTVTVVEVNLTLQVTSTSNNENDKIETVQAKDALKVAFEDDKDDLLPSEELSKNSQLKKLTEYVAYTEPPSPAAPDDNQASSVSVYQPMSTCLPTMWLGGQNCVLYVHSGLAQWSHCIHSVKLPDSILQIVHFKGRVFVALANGQCCIFVRSPTNGQWDFTKYLVIDMSKTNLLSGDNSNKTNKTPGTSSPSSSTPPTSTTASYSIRCMEVTKTCVWLGYRNMVHILDPHKLKIIHSLTVHPRKETQVRQLAAMGDGVWCSIRLDSTLRLYSALKPYQHLQDVDIEPYVSKMLTSKAFSFIRITALKASNNRLWIGTANGVILSIPCDKVDPTTSGFTSNSPSSGQSGNSLKSIAGSNNNNNNNSINNGNSSSGQQNEPSNNPKPSSTSSSSATLVAESDTGPISIATFHPKCNPSQNQLSYHGHKDAVKFFIMSKNLIMSGGEGYIDFRLNPDDESNSLSKGDRSHLIVWELNS